VTDSCVVQATCVGTVRQLEPTAVFPDTVPLVLLNIGLLADSGSKAGIVVIKLPAPTADALNTRCIAEQCTTANSGVRPADGCVWHGLLADQYRRFDCLVLFSSALYPTAVLLTPPVLAFSAITNGGVE
jgi:hypothetical protein